MNKHIYLNKNHWFPRTALIMHTGEDDTWAVTIRHTSPRKQKEFKSYKNAESWAKRMGAISLVQIAGTDTDRHGVLAHTVLDPEPFKSLNFLN